MGCRCAERQKVINNAARKIAKGDVSGAVKSMQTVVRSTVTDVDRAARAGLARLRPSSMKR